MLQQSNGFVTIQSDLFSAPKPDFRQECLEGSKIAPDVYDLAIKVKPDIEYDEYTHEVLDFPIAEALGRNPVRFGHQATPNQEVPFFIDELGEVWQGKTKDGYRAPKGIGDKPYFPPIPPRIVSAIATKYNAPVPKSGVRFWQWMLSHPEIPLVLTEGGKKALCLVSISFPAIALYGCRCGVKVRDENGVDMPAALSSFLVPYAKDRVVIIALDRDVKPTARQSVVAGIASLSEGIKNAGGMPFVAFWEPELGKGIDDVVSQQGEAKAIELIENSVLYEDYKKTPILATRKDLLQDYKPHESSENCSADNAEDGKEEILVPVKHSPSSQHTKRSGVESISGSQVFPYLKGLYSQGNVRFNLRSKEIEIDGTPIKMETFRVSLQDDHGVFVKDKSLAVESVLRIAENAEYDPVKEFLDGCLTKYDPQIDGEFDIPELCQVLFGVHDPLYCEYLYRWLIAIVQRVYEPGCKWDNALLLQGAEYAGKSSFFKAIAGAQWFNDSLDDIKNKDTVAAMASNWIVEWGEIDRMTAKTSAGVIKSFLSTAEDQIRLPYASGVAVRFARGFVIVGSTNRTDFMNDSDENRRYWVIPVAQNHSIPIALVKEIRERLLGWAVWKYLSGETSELSLEYRKLQKEENRRWMVTDVWLEVLEKELANCQRVCTHECLSKLENGGWFRGTPGRSDSMRISGILKLLGFVKETKQSQFEGSRIHFYTRHEKMD